MSTVLSSDGLRALKAQISDVCSASAREECLKTLDHELQECEGMKSALAEQAVRTQEKADELVDRCNLALEVLRLTETQKTELSATLDEILRLIHRRGKPWVDSHGRLPSAGAAASPPAAAPPPPPPAHLRGKKVLVTWTLVDRSRKEEVAEFRATLTKPLLGGTAYEIRYDKGHRSRAKIQPTVRPESCTTFAELARRLEEGEEVHILASDYDKDPGDPKNLRATTMRLWKDKRRLLSANDTTTSRKRRRDASPEATTAPASKKKKKKQPKRRRSPRNHK